VVMNASRLAFGRGTKGPLTAENVRRHLKWRPSAAGPRPKNVRWGSIFRAKQNTLCSETLLLMSRLSFQRCISASYLDDSLLVEVAVCNLVPDFLVPDFLIIGVADTD